MKYILRLLIAALATSIVFAATGDIPFKQQNSSGSYDNKSLSTDRIVFWAQLSPLTPTGPTTVGARFFTATTPVSQSILRVNTDGTTTYLDSTGLANWLGVPTDGALNAFAADPTSNGSFDPTEFKSGLELVRRDVGLDAEPSYTFLIVGDSTAQSYSPAAGAGSDWPTQLFAKSNWSGRGAVVNTATSSETLATISARWANVEGKLKPAVGAAGYAFIMGGINDLNAGTSAVNIEGYLTTIWADARSDGRKVVAFTVPAVPSIVGAPATQLALLNAWILAQSDKWDYCIDISDLSGSTWDNTHQTKAGNGTIATRIDTAIGAPWTD